MLESGIPPDNPAMESATRWLIDKQILRGGDWQVKAPETPPGGWAFEFANNNYPDIDDVSEVLIALKMARLPAMRTNVASPPWKGASPGSWACRAPTAGGPPSTRITTVPT